MVLDGIKAQIQAKLPPAVFEPLWKCIICIVAFLVFLASSYAWGAGGGNPFWFFDAFECFWHAIPFVIAYDICWGSSLWIAIVSVVDLVAPQAAVKLVCCSRDLLGKICWFSGVAYIVCRILSWLLAVIINPCSDYGYTRGIWSGTWMWTSWTFWFNLLVCMPVGFVVYMIIFPQGSQGSAGGGGGQAPYQSMPPQQQQQQEQNGAGRL
eukprot:TRINITY_DN2468_c0_g3_i1.p2 TRINITY_DN2468_c0_g3~~TRINITY_DN2468_c0_g3_i1.p2  ORF type:complete len:209 (+),score=69.57 TRINITY_DN2468_c0_g3_i1:56-682(+)